MGENVAKLSLTYRIHHNKNYGFDDEYLKTVKNEVEKVRSAYSHSDLAMMCSNNGSGVSSSLRASDYLDGFK